MPFSMETEKLLGRKVIVNPERGFGWIAVSGDKVSTELDTPKPFEAVLTDALSGYDYVCAVVGRISIEMNNSKYSWVCFIPRTTITIDLTQRPVGCNIFISDRKPYLVDTEIELDPEQIRSASNNHIRGFGRIFLVLDN